MEVERLVKGSKGDPDRVVVVEGGRGEITALMGASQRGCAGEDVNCDGRWMI